MPPPGMRKHKPPNMDATLHAVCEECRYKSLFGAVRIGDVLNAVLSELDVEAEKSSTHKSDTQQSSAQHSTTSARREESAAQSFADAATTFNSTEDPPFFIPLLDSDNSDNSDDSQHPMLDVEAHASSDSDDDMGDLATSLTGERGKAKVESKATRSLAAGATNSAPPTFPHPNSHWECGIYRGKRVYIETGGSHIGRGATALVYEGWMVITETAPDGAETILAKIPVAVKGVNYDARPAEVRRVFRLAVNIRLAMLHPGIVHSFYAGTLYPRYLQFLTSEKAMMYSFLVLARSTTGSVADVVKRSGPFAEDEIRLCMAELLDVLQCLHEEHHRVHNDVKPHNILIFDDPNIYYTEYKYQVTDLTAVTTATPLADVVREAHATRKERLSTSLAGGTAVYMSPESCLGLSMLCSNDVWSLGITAFHMATGTLPWRPLERQYPSMIMNGYRQKYTLQTLFGAAGVDWREGSTCSGVSEAGQYVGAHAGRGGGSPETSGVGNTTQAFREQYRDFGPILDVLGEVNVSDDFRDFLSLCLTENPMHRPTSRELRRHPFVKSVGVAHGD